MRRAPEAAEARGAEEANRVSDKAQMVPKGLRRECDDCEKSLLKQLAKMKYKHKDALLAAARKADVDLQMADAARRQVLAENKDALVNERDMQEARAVQELRRANQIQQKNLQVRQREVRHIRKDHENQIQRDKENRDRGNRASQQARPRTAVVVQPQRKAAPAKPRKVAKRRRRVPCESEKRFRRRIEAQLRKDIMDAWPPQEWLNPRRL